jgi:hypothetical protein
VSHNKATLTQLFTQEDFTINMEMSSNRKRASMQLSEQQQMEFIHALAHQILNYKINPINIIDGVTMSFDRLCDLVVRVLGYRSGGPGSIPSTTKKKVAGLERGPLSLVSTTEELLDRKVAAPV